MKSNKFRNVLFLTLLVGGIGAILGFNLLRYSGHDESSGVFTLQAPLFVKVASAAEPNVVATIEDEAGISAYFQAASSITIDSNLISVFRTIEAQTPDYIIGSIEITGYPESEDVHVYVHVDGWLLAYYLNDDPVAKVFDWRDYANSGGASISTKLEMALTTAAGGASVPYITPTFYDFRYPNATHMMLIAETYDNGNDFSFELPSSFVFYERSWGVYERGYYEGGSGYWTLDDTTIADPARGCDCTDQGFLTASQMLPDTPHIVQISDFGGLALIYQE